MICVKEPQRIGRKIARYSGSRRFEGVYLRCIRDQVVLTCRMWEMATKVRGLVGRRRFQQSANYEGNRNSLGRGRELRQRVDAQADSSFVHTHESNYARDCEKECPRTLPVSSVADNLLKSVRVRSKIHVLTNPRDAGQRVADSETTALFRGPCGWRTRTICPFLVDQLQCVRPGNINMGTFSDTADFLHQVSGMAFDGRTKRCLAQHGVDVPLRIADPILIKRIKQSVPMRTDVIGKSASNRAASLTRTAGHGCNTFTHESPHSGKHD